MTLRHVAITTLAALLSLAGCTRVRHETKMEAAGGEAAATVLLAFGDIQQTYPVPASIQQAGAVVDVEAFAGMSLDTHLLGARDGEAVASESLRLADIVKEFAPRQILQTGDLVDFNDALALDVQADDGAAPITVKLQGSEWDVLSFFPDPKIVFPTVGNHENLRAVVYHLQRQGDGRAVVSAPPSVQLNDAQQRKALLLAHFPQLEAEAAFLGETASYFREFPDYCLLSFDGNDLMTFADGNSSDASFLGAIDAALGSCGQRYPAVFAKPIIVIDHFPLFSATTADFFALDMRQKLVDLFNKHKVSLVLNGHQHHYLRYKSAWLPKVGYTDVAPSSLYATVGCFGCPYLDKTAGEVQAYPRFDFEDNQADKAGVGVDQLVYFPDHHFAEIRLEGPKLELIVHNARTGKVVDRDEIVRE